MASKIKFLISNDVWDNIDNGYWSPYSGPPCHVTKLNGYVLCSLSNLVKHKINMFKNIKDVQTFEDINNLKKFKKSNKDLWVTE